MESQIGSLDKFAIRKNIYVIENLDENLTNE